MLLLLNVIITTSSSLLTRGIGKNDSCLINDELMIWLLLYWGLWRSLTYLLLYKAQLPRRSLWGSHSSLILPYINTYKVCSISRATLSWLILTLIYTYFINFKLNIKHHSSIIYVIDLIVIDLSCYEACYIHKAQATSSTYGPQSYAKLLKIMYASKYI